MPSDIPVEADDDGDHLLSGEIRVLAINTCGEKEEATILQGISYLALFRVLISACSLWLGMYKCLTLHLLLFCANTS